jgi:hypothetical protein
MLSRKLALGALPMVRAAAKHPPSPQVQRRAREIEARARRVLGPAPLAARALGKAVEGYTVRRLDAIDPLDKPPAQSNPRMQATRYDRGKKVRAVREKASLLRAPLRIFARPSA